MDTVLTTSIININIDVTMKFRNVYNDYEECRDLENKERDRAHIVFIVLQTTFQRI